MNEIIALVFSLVALVVAVSFWVWSIQQLRGVSSGDELRTSPHFARVDVRLDDHETRISRLEGTRS